MYLILDVSVELFPVSWAYGFTTDEDGHLTRSINTWPFGYIGDPPHQASNISPTFNYTADITELGQSFSIPFYILSGGKPPPVNISWNTAIYEDQTQTSLEGPFFARSTDVSRTTWYAKPTYTYSLVEGLPAGVGLGLESGWADNGPLFGSEFCIRDLRSDGSNLYIHKSHAGV